MAPEVIKGEAGGPERRRLWLAGWIGAFFFRKQKDGFSKTELGGGVDIFRHSSLKRIFFSKHVLFPNVILNFRHRLQIRWFIFYIFLWQFGTVRNDLLYSSSIVSLGSTQLHTIPVAFSEGVTTEISVTLKMSCQTKVTRTHPGDKTSCIT